MTNPVGPRASDPNRMLDDAAVTTEASNDWALALLRRAQPYQAPAGRRERIAARLESHPHHPRTWALRLAVAAAVIVALGALTSAVAGGRWPAWIRNVVQQLTGAGADSQPTPSRRARIAPAPVVAAAPTAATNDDDIAPTPKVKSAQVPIPARQIRRPANPLSPEDTGPVIQAMRALRVDNDPVRARALAEPYLTRHPDGELAEEALAICIQAAAAHHDADAAALAARYLRLFPTGPFRGIALRTLKSP